MPAVEYTPGRWADVVGDPATAPVLLWHGTQTDARATLAPLAALLAEAGFGVVVPDWDSHAADRGRADLLRSVDYVRSLSSDPPALVGWSLGGTAAAGLTLHAADHGVVLRHTVCLAGAFTATDPISGTEPAPAEPVGAPMTLLHGTADDVVPVQVSRTFAAALAAVGWPVRVVELDTDHGAIAGARYDPAADRYFPAADPGTQRVAGEVAGHIATALGGPPAG
ncbi:dienelactone hydrolase family protein [Mycolicibacterium sp.]|uniref:dienelactone hydrolase family protein n=1 Tax=Mycolicibacterium sp. TaxID=2320850 RepID=UPI003D0B1FEB